MESRNNLPELHIAVDVEADGPIPGPYSMISLGMAVAGRPDLTFYTETFYTGLRPILDEFVPQALAVSGLDRGRLLREAPEAMAAAAAWVDELRAQGRAGVDWGATRRSRIEQELGLTGLPHTHQAGEDAAELAAVFDAVRRSRPAR